MKSQRGESPRLALSLKMQQRDIVLLSPHTLYCVLSKHQTLHVYACVHAWVFEGIIYSVNILYALTSKYG